MKKIFATLLSATFALTGPSLALAAYNDVTLTTDTIFTVNGITIVVAGSSASVESVSVGATSMDVTIEPGSSFLIQAPSYNVMTDSLASGAAYTKTSSCHASLSEMNLSSSATSTITITPSTSICPSDSGGSGGGSSGGGGGSSGGGGGGGSAASVTATPVATTTTSTTVSTAPAASAPSASITALLAQLQSLIATLKSLGGTVSPTLEATIASLTGTPAASGAFTRDLKVGATGADVKTLQQWLNAHGFKVSASGPGSPGNETSMFGGATRAALAKFQAANKIVPAVGYFGPKTRALVNGM